MSKNTRYLFVPLVITVMLLTAGICRAAGKCFMWEAKRGQATVYLLGSIHMGTKEMYPLNPAIENAFKKSDYLALETNLTPEAQMLAAMMVMQAGMYPPNESLDKKVSKNTLNQLTAYLKKKNQDINQYKNMRPWLIAMSLLKLEVHNINVSEEYGIEKHFVNSAGEMPIIEFETITDQISLLSSGTDLEQELALSESLQNLPTTQSQMTKMISVWTNGDAPGMTKIVQDSLPKNPKLQKRTAMLLDDRNQKMSNKIMEFFKTDKTYFVVVGSAHLTGNNGIVSVLQKNGCQINQVNKTTR